MNRHWNALVARLAAVAAVLLIIDHGAWPYFGLVGGGMYFYFAGRGISTRLAMRRRGLQIGSAGSLTLGLVFLGIWGAMGFAMIIAGAAALLTPQH